MYAPISSEVWTGRVDHEDGDAGLRWHQTVQQFQFLDSSLDAFEGKGIVFLGFECEEGVRRNKGRIGAKEGPMALRWALSGLPVHFDQSIQLWDGGNIICEGERLEQAQAQLGDFVEKVLAHQMLPIVLGGGHEVAWGSFLGLQPQLKQNRRLGILNFDAHFDLRKPANGPSSGTPFYQMMEWGQKEGIPLSYFVWGIQQTGNTRALFDTADRFGVAYLTMDQLAQLRPEAQSAHLNQWLSQVDDVYVSIDLDGFDVAYAPGVSAINIAGLTPKSVFPLLHTVVQSGKLRLLDVAEMNPQFDQDNRTAKLGARCIWEILQYLAV